VVKQRTKSRFKTLDLTQRRIGYRLAFVRKCNGITQQRCAVILGLTRYQVANIEVGRVPLKKGAAWRICDAFWIHPAWLAIGREPMNRTEMEDEKWGSFLRLAKSDGEISYWKFWTEIIAGNKYFELFGSDSEAGDVDDMKVSLDIAPAFSQSAGVKEIRSLSELLNQVRRLTAARGRKAELAKALDVSRQAVDQWLSEATKPSAETTFALLAWVRKHGGNQT
jgi:transcriptional regulator with XRE-family HTH domain